MTHHHPHDHGHTHDHDHHHHTESEMTFEEKIQTLLSHWINHNNDHAKNYMDWSQKTKDAGKQEIADLLSQASEMTKNITSVFEKALALAKQ